MTIAIAIPEKRFLSREEAAEWLGVCVDTFTGFGIDYVDLGPRNRRWDIFDIINFVLAHTWFSFGYNVYKIIGGTAMGLCHSVALACIFMAALLDVFFKERPIWKAILW